MPGVDLIVVGASAGGVEALSELVAGLPADLPAAVLVVLHVAPSAPSVLPRILGRAGRLPVVHATDGMPIQLGRVHIAPPDRHLVVHGGTLRLVYGPREHAVRPAVDPLFRSAAAAFGRRVAGVVLSGNLYDGAAGLRAVKDAGGVALVQDPAECLFDGMPRSALERVAVDAVLPVAALAERLVKLVGTAPAPTQGATIMIDPVEAEAPQPTAHDAALEAHIDEGARRNERMRGRASGYTCPECHGALWEMADGEALAFRCRVGHAFSDESLLMQQGGALEAALWSALVAVEEHAALIWRMAQRAGGAAGAERRQRYEEKARRLEASAQVIRESLRSAGSAAASPADATADAAVAS